MPFHLFFYLSIFLIFFYSGELNTQESKQQKLQNIYPSTNERILLPSVGDEDQKDTIILQPPKEIIEALEREKILKKE